MLPTQILLVDDDERILQACRRVLRRIDAVIHTATTPEDALRLAKEHEFAVVVSDQRMPAMIGSILLDRIRAIQPHAVRVMMTGCTDISAAVDAINTGAVFRFLTKPWQDDQLRLAITQSIEQFRLVEENRLLQVLTESQNEQLRQLNEDLEARVADRTRKVSALSQRLDETLRGALKVLAQLMEINSTTIGNHSRRVADLAVAIAKQLGYSDEPLRQIEVAGLLHDIGKLLLPEAITRKERHRLTPEELGILRQHAADGEAIVRKIPYLDDAAGYIRHHHERCNGSGYPDRLCGAQIPEGARIIAVADEFDRQLNGRLSFSERTVTSVLGSIREHIDDWFDDRVVAALEAVIGQDHSGNADLQRMIEVSAADLASGMVIARDLYSDSGALLVRANTCMTDDTIRRLKNCRSLGGHAVVHVYRTGPSSPALTAG
ncbi:MAG: HD domain-containing protein [Planctomycetaceae bacterium]